MAKSRMQHVATGLKRRLASMRRLLVSARRLLIPVGGGDLKKLIDTLLQR